MQLIYTYGFSIDADTKKIFLDQGKFAGFNAGIPQGTDGITKGEDTGVIVGKTAKVGLDADLNLVYNDIKGKPYTGTVNTYGGLPHDEDGKLLVDSVGEIKDYKLGLAFTVNGVLAMDGNSAPDAIQGISFFEQNKSALFEFDPLVEQPSKGYWANIDDKENRQLEVLQNGKKVKAILGELNNDQDYIIKLYAVNDVGDGALSEAFEVTPHAPQVPSIPVITRVLADSIYIFVDFAPTDDYSAPADIIKWEVYEQINGKTPNIYTINDGAARTYRIISQAQEGDIITVWVRDYNEAGGSEPSISSTVTRGEIHLIDGGSRYQDEAYQYVVWLEDGDMIVNYKTRFDVFAVAGGGGGRGQLVPYGMGGNGGGGANKEFPDLTLDVGTYKVAIGGGAQGGGSTAGGNTKIVALNIDVAGGGTAQTKADGTPDTPKTKVSDAFNKCPIFSWNYGVSDYVSGFMLWDKTKQPDGKGYGQAGGGTNGTSGSAKVGNGQDGIAVVRYALPPLLPTNIRVSQQASKTLSVIFNNPTKRVPAKWVVQPYINGQIVMNKGKADNTTVFLFLLDGSSQSQAVQVGDSVTVKIYPDGQTYCIETPPFIWGS